METHLSIIEQANSQVVASCWQDRWPDGSVSSSCLTNNKIRLYNFSQSLKELRCRHGFIHTNTITIKKSLFDKAGVFPAGLCKRGGDIATWLRVLSENDGLAYLDKETAVYHREASTVTRNTPIDIQTDCVYRECIILKKLNPNLASEIMMISNKYILYGLADRMKKGLLTRNDMSFFYISKNKKIGWTLMFFSFMPLIVQKKTYELLYGLLARIGFSNKKLLWK
ncbi:MAG: hypothetical protein D3908_10930 [Candidatus Electrothrix sp. AUS4]|nr:hypothetical protein [Candidatus Electrothrix sp. AUS4]